MAYNSVLNTAAARTLTGAHKLILNKKITTSQILDHCYSQIASRDNLNSFISVRPQSEAHQEAEASQARYDLGKPLSEIDGLPIAIKDNILVKGMECTAASSILSGKSFNSLILNQDSRHQSMQQ